MEQPALKVGEVARRTGLTVRALRHYEAIGLIRPTRRTESGHRVYGREELARLQQALSLRALGLPLEQVREVLAGRGIPPREILRLHLHRLREQIAFQQALIHRLEALERGLAGHEELSAEELLRAMEAMTMVEKFYTPEQMETLRRRREEVGEERMRQAPHDWERLTAEMKAEMEAGTDPGDPGVQALARRWQALIDEFTGGDPGIAESLGRLWKEQGDELAARHGMEHDPRVHEYAGRALRILRGG